MRYTLGLVLACGAIVFAGAASADTRTSADYSLTTDIQDGGGSRATSGDYTSDGSIGAIGAVATASPVPMIAKSGYVGQLYDVTGFGIGAWPTNINEGTSRQLAAAYMVDDGTFLAMNPADVQWAVVSGPINSVSGDGIAAAGNVYQDTPASISGSASGFDATLGLAVINVTADDYGLYAGDGIDDDWQVLYFGVSNPQAGPGMDPDRDGRSNLFESFALTIPTDGTSFFQLRAAPGPLGTIDLIFGPIRSGRTYTVMQSPDLLPDSWLPLMGTIQSDIGDQRKVTDPDALQPKRFYRVHIGR